MNPWYRQHYTNLSMSNASTVYTVPQLITDLGWSTAYAVTAPPPETAVDWLKRRVHEVIREVEWP